MVVNHFLKTSTLTALGSVDFALGDWERNTRFDAWMVFYDKFHLEFKRYCLYIIRNKYRGDCRIQ